MMDPTVGPPRALSEETVERIGNKDRLKEICAAGRGVVYNDFSGHGASGAQYNVVHATSCRWLLQSSPSVPKFLFEDLETAIDWLTSERGAEGRAWKRCGTCHGLGRRSDSQRQSQPLARVTSAGGLGPIFLVRADPGGALVEAWSSRRLPFEPRGVDLEFRSALREAIRTLRARPPAGLRAEYASASAGVVDTENVVFYNVGAEAFAGVDGGTISFERSYVVPAPPASAAGASHFHRYEVTEHMSWRHWGEGPIAARFGPTRVPSLSTTTAMTQAWHAIRTGPAEVSGSVRGGEPFGLVIDVSGPYPAHLTSVMKPLIDGVVAAFHRHDGTDLPELARRVGGTLAIDPALAGQLLTGDDRSVLGRRRLLWRRAAGVQWNPGDDLLLAVLIRMTASSGPRADWMVEGRIVQLIAPSVGAVSGRR